MNGTLTTLPSPPADRWRPTRAGLISLWRYWDETFTFHRGRLLLRGPNGAGKSMALELLLPFLLDADASPGRLTSAAKSRGGLYERVMTGTTDASRAGFAWVEFRRGVDVFTVGVRLRASANTRKVDHDFFTTSQAIGDDLQLLDEQRVPLSRKALVDAIGDRGRVHTTGEEHRTAVRETLYTGFSADRYDSVVTALLALRKEKLSQNLDLDKLSGVLSEALPPLDEHDLATVAEGFERLDRRSAELAALEAELAEVNALASRQRDYARSVVASLADEVRAAESRRDGVTRREREALDELAVSRDEATAMDVELRAIGERLSAVDVEIAALRDSGAYRDGAELDDLRAQARRLGEHMGRAERAAGESAVARDEAEAALGDAEADHDTAVANRAVAANELRQSATQVGADAAVADAEQLDNADEAEHLVRAWLSTRRALVGEVRGALVVHGDAITRRGYCEERVADDGEACARLDAAHRVATDAHAAAVDAYSGAVGEWAVACATIGVDRARAALPAAAVDPDDVEAAVAALGVEVHAEQAVERQGLDIRRAEAVAARAELTAERERFAKGRLVEPDAPRWRSDRAAHAGAPLWRLVDVVAGVDAGTVDGLEAALTALGLLDAWVSPDGEVDWERADVTLTVRPVTGATLADSLTPLEQGAVPTRIVDAVLRSVPVGPTAVDAAIDGELVLGADGTFRAGAAAGLGQRRPASVLGSAAQERRRLARLAEIDEAIAAVDTRLASLDRDAEALAHRAAAGRAELAALPSSAPLGEAVRVVGESAARLGEADDHLARSRRALASAEEAVRGSLRALTSLGARHGLPTDADSLTDVDAALGAVERSASAWVRRAGEAIRAQRARDQAARRAEQASRAADRAAADFEAARRDATEVEGRVAGLESTIGQEYQEVLARLGALGDEQRQAVARQRSLHDERPQLERRVGRLETAVDEAEAARLRADDDRAEAHRRFVAAHALGLAADAAVPVQAALDGVTNVLSAARSVAAELDGVGRDEQAIERASARVEERLHQTRARLGGRVDHVRELTDDGWWTLSAFAGGIRRRAAQLGDAFAGELEQARAEFLAEEERLFEQVLAGSVRRSLASRIRLANRLVEGINEQLAHVRTAGAEVAVRLRWEVDPDQLDAVKSARALLLRDPGDLSEDETDALQAFVRARVDQARAELEANAPWEARLRETLDYRSWHRFTLQLAHRDWEGFQTATPRRLQRLSTGERSIALHLPMLASIAAHYADEDGQPAACPRLVLLDELFAGVDTANRAQLFGTFTSWGLDAMLTSDHEWCQYATFDGIAVHHLHPPTGDEPVTSTRFTWDGRQRTIDPSAA